MTPDWMHEAACKGQNPDWFHPPADRGYLANYALKLCDQCPVKTPCLEYALQFPAYEDISGVYGGTTSRDRQRIRRGQPPRPKQTPGPKPRPVTGMDRA